MAHGVALAIVATPATPAAADEGLWPIDEFPIDRINKLHGINLSQAWLAHVRGAAVRLSSSYGGCSASLVSANGLVLTNNHCVAECAQDVSEPGQDRYANGYVADDRDAERRCGKLTAEVVVSIDDVTAKIAAAPLGAGDAAAAHTAAMARVRSAECPPQPGTRCDIVEFSHGAQYKLIRYRSYDDVRLVFSAGAKAALLEGDRFPPPLFDAAFLRVYDRGQPAVTPDHLRWNAAAPRTGEVTFLMGSPRVSERQLTVSQLKTERDVLLPNEQIETADLIGRLTRFGEESTANREASQFQLSDIQNHFGYTLDLTATLRDEALFARKVAEEADLSRRGGQAVQAPLKVIDDAERARRAQALSHHYLVEGPQAELFKFACLLLRGAVERAKADAARLPGYADAELPAREKAVSEERPVYGPLEQLQLEAWLASAARTLPADDPTRATLLDGATPEALAARLAQSKLGDPALRRQLWVGGLAAVRASSDPMVQFMLKIEPATDEARTKWTRTVSEPETAATSDIARLRRQLYGASVYPDANRTLRINAGRIDGFTADGRQYGPFTRFADLGRYIDQHGSGDIDRRWIGAIKSLQPKTVLTMSTTNDGINGNSGSPIMNKDGDVIGLFFGGNDSAMGGNYLYDPVLNRATAVSAAAITEALRKVYGANRLTQELDASSKKAET